jgi:hypothetical protein
MLLKLAALLVAVAICCPSPGDATGACVRVRACVCGRACVRACVRAGGRAQVPDMNRSAIMPSVASTQFHHAGTTESLAARQRPGLVGERQVAAGDDAAG